LPGFLGASFGIEQQGVIFSSGDGIFVQPGMPVGDVPESNAVDDAFVFAENGKDFFILVGLALL